MAEYIDREVFKKSVEEYYCKPCKAEGRDHNGCWCRACWVDDMFGEVIDAPPADVAPVRHGRWEEASDGDGIVCPFCRTDFCTIIYDTEYFNYCPNCGAKMDEPVGNSDRLEENKE